MSDSNNQAAFQIHPSSFRDPSGFIFQYNGELFRQVNQSFRENYDFFISSGLYQSLVEQKQLIPHTETAGDFGGSGDKYKVLQPDKIDFISYPYEWCFDMLKDAALLTLTLAKKSLGQGMILKDATSYNIQWHKDRLVFIDTLSFEKYEEGKPWIAYRQFCECFLGPLLLMHYQKTSLHELQLAYPNGIPLPIIKKLLPWKSRFSILTYLHIHLHAKIAAKNKGKNEGQAMLPKKKMLSLIASLETLVNSLSLQQTGTTWGNYYDEAALRDDYLDQKKKIIMAWLDEMPGLQTGIDFGANEGEFSSLLSARNTRVISVDADPVAVSKLYHKVRSGKQQGIIPLVMDLSNPSPATGLNNKEHSSFAERIQNRDIGLCLALLHHLCLGRNIPFLPIAESMHASCKKLIIEFVPKSDIKSQQILSGKRDIYDGYTSKDFERSFEKFFTIREKRAIPGTERILYLMERR